LRVGMPNIGDALKKAVELKPSDAAEDTTGSRPTSALMNAGRRHIFQYLCAHPCSGQADIVTGLVSTRSSVAWHLDKLIEAEYIVIFEFMGKTTYCPNGMVSVRNMPLFAVLASKDCLAMYRAILANPGSDKVMLGRATAESPAKVGRCMKWLLETGLIVSIRDGRHARYFPTERSRDALREERPVYKEFVRRLVKRLRDEHLKPNVNELKGAGVVIEIAVLGRTERIEIPNRDPER